MSNDDKINSGKWVLVNKTRMLIQNWTLIISFFTALGWGINRDAQFQHHLESETMHIDLDFMRRFDTFELKQEFVYQWIKEQKQKELKNNQ